MEESMQSKGGRARARALTPEQRSEIASRAAATRWGTQKATHTGILQIGNSKIECHVLEDGTRVLSRIGVLRAMGRTGKAKGGRAYDDEFGLPVFLTANNLKPFITSDLLENSAPVHFIPAKGGASALGYKAELLPQICSVFLDADDAGDVSRMQEHIVQQCKILLRGLATIGITALVDEATGYQEVRDRDALQAILDKYLRKEFAAWAKRFPDQFYREIFRLRKWEWKGMRVNRPQIVGKWTTDLVYNRLAPGITDELQRRNPPQQRKRVRNQQFLTEDVGHPALAQHLHAVIALMKASSSWEQFRRLVDRALPQRGKDVQLDFIEDD